MSFDYERIKKEEETGSHWTSYSDLFMALSVVFLLLYVVASVRSGTFGIQQHMEYQKLAQEAADLKQQIQVYSTLKNDYLERDATEQEQVLYEELMNKLSLLQEEAKDEKEELRRQADENAKKEMALNKYQQMIRNIINTNMVAKARIKRRDTIIDEKESEINVKYREVAGLQKNVVDKQQQLEESEREMTQVRSQLDRKVKELQSAYKQQKISKKRMEESIARFKQESEERLKDLQAQAQQVSEELQATNTQLKSVSRKLSSAEGTIAQQEKEKQSLMTQLQQTSAEYAEQMKGLQAKFEQQRESDRAAFENELKKQKLSAIARAKREAEFARQAAEKERQMQAEIASIQKQMAATQGQLKKAQAQANARKILASRIRKNLAAAGVKASVDGETGDVVIDFGDHYFDTGRANLKPEMRKVIEKAMPAYSNSLFSDPKIANKISAVEIVGYASPTYKGKYVDPDSLNPSDRIAVEYNLDLSYQRAKSIFNYVFDTDKMQFPDQKRLLPLVKVTGRSFLTEAKKGRGIASGTSMEDFCKQYDCKKAQRVIIKFNLQD